MGSPWDLELMIIRINPVARGIFKNFITKSMCYTIIYNMVGSIHVIKTNTVNLHA
jgi:hypothetical protein